METAVAGVADLVANLDISASYEISAQRLLAAVTDLRNHGMVTRSSIPRGHESIFGAISDQLELRGVFQSPESVREKISAQMGTDALPASDVSPILKATANLYGVSVR
eukprot:TRINITY_DN10348_c0_g1_i1.p1 TRINITY_DN10348_c0_g1~~TRINITY_DN10348_c0_g1_i1.p1  ORF type:complete len:119 (+),score=0.46 TRINITY_DN10348_c0_g1_i1:36-359(+)